MPPKKSAKELSSEPSVPATSSRRGSFASPEKPLGPLSIPVSAEERDLIKVNNANPTDLKNACDDALKRVRIPRMSWIASLSTAVQYLSRPNLFKQIHLHTDVRLTLGWAGVLVAAATGLYGWKVEFEQSKPAVWAGFIMHVSRQRTHITPGL